MLFDLIPITSEIIHGWMLPIIGSCIELSAEILRVFDFIPDISDTLHKWVFDLITTPSDAITGVM